MDSFYTFSMDLTEQCNLACKYCYKYGRSEKKLSLDIAMQMVDYFFERAQKPSEKPYYIYFSGGEPFLEFGLMKDIVNYIEKKELSNKVVFIGTTNVTLLDEEMLSFWIRRKHAWQLSIDGIKEVHDKYRRTIDDKGTLDIIKEKIPLIIKYWPNAIVRITVVPEHGYYFYDSIKWLYEQGFRWISFSLECETLNWTDNDLNNLINQYEKVLYFLDEKKDLHCHPFNRYINKREAISCASILKRRFSFSIDGSVYPCQRFNKIGEENLLSEKWKIANLESDISFNNHFYEFSNIIREKCKGCRLWEYCYGGAPCTHFNKSTLDFEFNTTYCKHFKMIHDLLRRKGYKGRNE